MYTNMGWPYRCGSSRMMSADAHMREYSFRVGSKNLMSAHFYPFLSKMGQNE